MKLKPIVASLCLLGMATAGTALAASNTSTTAQIKSLQKQLNQLQMKVNKMNTSAPTRMSGVSNVLALNSDLSSMMMSNYSGTGREMTLLQARQNGAIANQTLTVGGEAQADALYQHTNNPGYFSNPIANSNGTGASNTNARVSSVGKMALSNVRLASTVALNNWATGYVQVGSYNVGNSNTLNGGSGTVGSNNLAIQNAYVVLGNLAQNPVYGFFGRKDIDFGSFASVQPYSQPLTRIYFMPTGNTAGVGYTNYGVNVTASVMNGGTYGNVENVGSIIQSGNLYTANANGINNYALNASYSHMNSGVNWTVGAGYLDGSNLRYISPTDTSQRNGAWDLNAKASVNNFDLLAEYVSTVHSTLSYDDTALAGSSTVFPNAILRAWSLGGDYKFPVMGYNSVAALSYSKLSQGQSAFNAYQYVASYRVQPFSSNNVWTGLEYAYSKGLVGGQLSAGATIPAAGGTNTVVTTGSNAVNNTVVLDVTAFF